MMQILKFSDANFAAEFRRIEQRAEAVPAEIETTVKAIIADVRQRGDQALFEYTAKFDRLELSADTLFVSAEEIDSALARVSAGSLNAFQRAAERMADDHAKQKQETCLSTDENDMLVGHLQDISILAEFGRNQINDLMSVVRKWAEAKEQDGD